MRHVAAVIPVLLALAGESPSAGEGGSEKKYEWPMIAGDAGWTNYSADPRVKPPFRLKWATQLGVKMPSTLSVGGGKVFARGICLDAETGEVLWKSGLTRNTPTYYRGRLYAGGNKVSVSDAATGKRLWSKHGYRSSKGRTAGLAVCDGAVYSGQLKEQGGKKFYFATALDAQSGKQIWSTPLTAVVEKKRKSYELMLGAMGSLTVAGGRVLVTTHTPKMVFALDQKTGKVLWRQEGVCARHALGTDGKYVWAAEAEEGLWALDAATGKKLWHWGGTDKGARAAHYLHYGTADYPPAVADGVLVVSNYGRQYTGLDTATGKQLWVAGDKGGHAWAGGCGPPTGAAGYIYANGLIGKDFQGRRYRFQLYAVDQRTGKPVWKYPLVSKSCARVSVAYGRLYVVAYSETCCFEPVGHDYREPQPQAAPARPAGPLKPLARPFGGKAGEASAVGKPKGGAEWPMYGGCPARCGLEVDIKLPVKDAWRFQTGGKVKSSPVSAGGMVYAGSDSGKLFALNLRTGGKKWEAKIGSWMRCAPAVAKGIVVCGADDGVLRAFDAKTGKPKWEFKTAGRIRSSPAVVGERVVFGSWDGRCYCVRLSDGKEFWRYRIGDPGVRVYAPPAVAQGRVYVGAFEDFQLHALDLGTGKPLAGYAQASGYVTKLGLVQGAAVYRGLVVTTSSKLMDPVTGKVLAGVSAWSSGLPALPAFSGGRVYQSSSPRGAVLSTAKAAPRRRKRGRDDYFKSSVLSAPLVGGDLLVAATVKGTLEVRRLPDEKSNEKSDEPAKLVWEWKSPSGAEIHTAPVAAGGFIVLGSDDGHVYGFSYK